MILIALLKVICTLRQMIIQIILYAIFGVTNVTDSSGYITVDVTEWNKELCHLTLSNVC